MGNPSESWTRAESLLRRLEQVPEALKSLAVLLSAHQKWHNAVEVRTSMHDLIFHMPGEPHPFERAVTVRWTFGGTLQLEKRGIAEHSQKVTLEEAPGVVDRALKWLVDGTLWCARCGGQVVAAANDYVTFENMHWVCFHYEFEHGLSGADVDADCGQAGCPTGQIRGLTGDEALVLFDWLSVATNGPEAAGLLDDPSRRAAADATLCLLESRLAEPFAHDYARRLQDARRRMGSPD